MPPKAKRLNVSGQGQNPVEDVVTVDDVWRVSGVENFVKAAQAVPVVPGDPHPDGPSSVRAKRISHWVRRDDMNQTFDITWRYEATGFTVAGIDPPEALPPVAVQVKRELQVRPVWRTPPFIVPPNTNYPGSGPSNDIGGHPVDVAGEPVDLPKYTMRIDFTGKLALPINESFISGMTGTRNNSSWRGYPAGTVLFMGLSNNHDAGDSFTDAHFEFSFDEWLHLEQVAFRRGGGRPQLTDAGNSDEQQHAKTVNFVQPFPALSNFGAFGFPIHL